MSLGMMDTHSAWVAHTLVNLREGRPSKLRRLCQGGDSRTVEGEIRLEIMRDLTDQARERTACGRQFTPGGGTGPVPVGLLHAAGDQGALSSGLHGRLLTRDFTVSGFSSCLQVPGRCGCTWLPVSPRVGRRTFGRHGEPPPDRAEPTSCRLDTTQLHGTPQRFTLSSQKTTSFKQ